MLAACKYYMRALSDCSNFIWNATTLGELKSVHRVALVPTASNARSGYQYFLFGFIFIWTEKKVDARWNLRKGRLQDIYTQT